jgi:WD40 repeat protein
VNAVSFSPDASIVASSADDKWLKLWAPGSEEALYQDKSIDETMCLAFSPDGSKLASGSMDRAIRVWSIAELVGPQSTKSSNIATTFDTPALSALAVFTPEGGLIVGNCKSRSSFEEWTAEFETYSPPLVREAQDGIKSIAVSPDGSTIASACSNKNSVYLWTAGVAGRGSGPLMILKGHQHNVSCVAFHPGGVMLV